jgi:hypothetical protein
MRVPVRNTCIESEREEGFYFVLLLTEVRRG